VTFESLHLYFVFSWYHETTPVFGSVRQIGELFAVSSSPATGGATGILQLTDTWPEPGGGSVHRERRVGVSDHDVERLVEHIRAVWRDDHAPRVGFGVGAFGETAASVWSSLLLGVHLDGSQWSIWGFPALEIHGPDRDAVENLFSHLLEIAR
jgi:hypothetical protein